MQEKKRYTMEVFRSLLDDDNKKIINRKNIFDLLDVIPKETKIIEVITINNVYYNIKLPFNNNDIILKRTDLTKEQNSKIQKTMDDLTVEHFFCDITGNIIGIL